MAVRPDKNVNMGSHPYNDMNYDLPQSGSMEKVKNIAKLQEEYDNPKLKSKFRPSFLRSHYFSGSSVPGVHGH